jgi:prepilin-type N-terminal cleavage/methylation domain-containing protein
MSRNERKGFSLTELMISISAFGIIIIAVATFFSNFVKVSRKVDLNVRGYENVSNAVRTMENRLYVMNEISSCGSTFIIFIADINTYPHFDKFGDFDNDGVPNYLDSDMDGDATTYATAPDKQWTVGYNLKDDDDNKNGKIDMRWKYFLSDKTLYEDYSYDQENWGRHLKMILSGVQTNKAVFNYFGSKDPYISLTGAGLDTNSDGIVTSTEIDMAGNKNGKIDTQAERDYVSLIKLYLSSDINRDGKPEYDINTNLLPPMLYLKRTQK